MRQKHKVSAKDFKPGKSPEGTGDSAPMFSFEQHLSRVFSDAAMGSEEEALLATRTLVQILDDVPTLCTFAPVNNKVVTDDVSRYVDPNAPDIFIADEPTVDPATPHPRGQRRTSANGKVPRVAVRPASLRALPALPDGRPRGKDIRREFELHYETALWPSRPVHLPHTDLVKVMTVFPRASSVELAKSTADHFAITGPQAGALRRRFAAMVALEQDVVARIRRLLPVVADADAAMSAVRRISNLCSTLEQRKTDLPFE